MNLRHRNPQAYALYDFAKQSKDNKILLPKLATQIVEDETAIDYEKTIKSLFYGVNYSDYLMSLPMGSGKTYVMAALIYLELYFAQNEPDNEIFAHNF
ncbi:MAG: hypothetical protein HC803_07565 [Saprospiraceae bacterium]|nr:hypothetical protein [Saprospiraceae bacterium]